MYFSNQLGKLFYIYTAVFQSFIVAGFWMIPVSTVTHWVFSLASILLTGLALWGYKLRFKACTLAIRDGVWWIQWQNESVESVTPLSTSRLFPACMMLAIRRSDKRRRYLFFWKDVLGESHFRALSRELHRYFYLKNKSTHHK